VGKVMWRMNGHSPTMPSLKEKPLNYSPRPCCKYVFANLLLIGDLSFVHNHMCMECQSNEIWGGLLITMWVCDLILPRLLARCMYNGLLMGVKLVGFIP
jgi:hypothetical protein